MKAREKNCTIIITVHEVLFKDGEHYHRNLCRILSPRKNKKSALKEVEEINKRWLNKKLPRK